VRRVRAGFSLLECLLTIGLTLLVIGLGGDLMMRYSDQLRFAASHEDASTALTTALQQTGDELRESLTLTHPTSSTPSAELLYTIYDPSQAWLPTQPPPTGTAPPGFTVILPNLLPTSGQLSVHVTVAPDGSLARDVQPVGGGVVAHSVLARGIASLSCSLTATGLVRMQLNLSGAQAQTSLVHAVWRTAQ
jgi:hypothetical protein